jgi:hypothetical protein
MGARHVPEDEGGGVAGSTTPKRMHNNQQFPAFHAYKWTHSPLLLPETAEELYGRGEAVPRSPVPSGRLPVRTSIWLEIYS